MKKQEGYNIKLILPQRIDQTIIIAGVDDCVKTLCRNYFVH